MTHQNHISPRIAALIFFFVMSFTINKSVSAQAVENVTFSDQSTDTALVLQAYHNASGNQELITIDVELAEQYFEKNSLEYYAYMDIDSVDSELIPIILEARNRIIFTTSWTHDEVDGKILDENRNAIEDVPHFHEVFPEDWEIPCFPSSSKEYPIYHYG